MKIMRLLNGSVAVRTTFLVLFMITAIMLTAGILQVHHVRKIVAAEVHRQASRSMEGAITVIGNRVSNVETAVITASAYADKFAYDEHRCYDMLERLISYNKDISAATILYRENFFPNHGRYYAPTISKDPFTNELSFDEIGGLENDFDYLETDSNWVYTNKLRGGYWCLPYVDSISTKRGMVTYSVPLYDDKGEIFAVLCADVALDWVKQIVEEAKPYDYCRVMVLSRDSQYICHPDPEFIQTVNVIQQAEEQKDTSFLNLTRRMLDGEKGTDTLIRNFAVPTGAPNEAHKSNSVVFYAPIPKVVWSVCFTIPEAKIMQGPNNLRNYMIMLLIIMLLLISITLYFVIRAQLFPMKLLAQSTREVAMGHFDFPLPHIGTHDEIRNLRDSFENMQGALSRYVEELQITTASKASIESELNVATDIQMSMLPKEYPAFPDRDDILVFGLLKPAKAVGGDLYDYYIRDEKLFFCIGDVSGKGVPASLVMASTRVLFRTLSRHEAMPDRIISQMNDALAQQNESNMFVTLFIGVLDLPSGRLRYCNAGHDAPLLVGNGVSLMPCDSNIPCGVMPDWKFTAQELFIYHNTTIFLYTDGLTEAENINHQLFGEERMKIAATASLQECTHQPEVLVGKMAEQVHSFVGEAVQSDDLTMLAIQYTKEVRMELMRRSIVLPNDVQAVPQLAQFVDEVCEELGFDMPTSMQLNLAMEEAVVNVMNYAYPYGSKGDIEITAHANEVRLKFVIVDSGKPFDPTAKADVDINLSAEDRPIGGLGIHLVRQIMDSINYEYLDGKNVLTLRKKRVNQSNTES